jgi:membrane protein
LPSEVYNLVRETVEEIRAGSFGGKVVVSLLITLWSASYGLESIRNAMNAVYGLRETRFWIRLRLQSITLTIVLGMLVTIVVAFFFVGSRWAQVGLAGIVIEISSPALVVGIQWTAVIVVLLFSSEVIYNLLPNFKVRPGVWVTPGSIVAIVVWIPMIVGFRIYITYFGSWGRTYGSLEAVIVLLFWLYLTSMALLGGGLINAVLAEWSEKKVEEDEKETKNDIVAEPEKKAEEPNQE